MGSKKKSVELKHKNDLWWVFLPSWPPGISQKWSTAILSQELCVD